MNKYILSLTFIFIPFAIFAGTYTVKNVPNVQLQDATRFVANPDGIISQDAENVVNNKIALVRDSATAEIAVVLLQSIGDEDIDDFATSLFDDWKIGKRERDNGLLFLLVYDQRQMVFRTGYGLEGVLPDAVLSRIIRDDISPSLKTGDFDQGIISGIDKVCGYLLNPEAIPEIYAKGSWPDNKKDYSALKAYLSISFIVFLIFTVWSVSVLSSKKNNHRKYLSFSKGKGMMILFAIFFPVFMILFAVFFSFMKKRLRNKPIKCSVCGNQMHKLGQMEEVAYLAKSQQLEEKIRSIDYDVWLCDNCKNTEIYPYRLLSGKYNVCPHCNVVSYYLAKDYVVSHATTFSSGEGARVYNCKNCGANDKKNYTIPRIVATSSPSGRGSGFGGSSFGGGGSWGGGRTGGGGARGGW